LVLVLDFVLDLVLVLVLDLVLDLVLVLVVLEGFVLLVEVIIGGIDHSITSSA